MDDRDEQIRCQDERNQRLRPVDKKRKKKLARVAVSSFSCRTCKMEVKIPWRKMHGDFRPLCMKCDQPLTLVAACLNKGVIPKLSDY